MLIYCNYTFLCLSDEKIIKWSRELPECEYYTSKDDDNNKEECVVLLSLQSDVEHTYYKKIIRHPQNPLFNSMFGVDPHKHMKNCIASDWLKDGYN